MIPDHNLDNPLLQLQTALAAGQNPVRLTGLGDTARSYFFQRFLQDLQRPCLAVLPNKKEAEKFYRQLQFFFGESEDSISPAARRLFFFPPYDVSPLSGLSPHREIINRRLEALYALTAEPQVLVVTSLEAMGYKILPKTALLQVLEYLAPGEEVAREDLIQKLESCGYQRVSLVEERGDYSVRGGVVDIFPPLHQLPLRLEFWGSQLESIRSFDPFSQRSQASLEELILLPNNEILLSTENIRRARSMGRLPAPANEGIGFAGQEAWLNHFYPQLDSLLDYLPKHGVIAHFEPQRMEAVFKRLEDRFNLDLARFRDEAAEKGLPFPETDGLMDSGAVVSSALQRFDRIEISELDLGGASDAAKPPNSIHIRGPLQTDVELDVRVPGRGRVSLGPLAQRIDSWLARGGRVVIVSRTDKQSERLAEILENYDLQVNEKTQTWPDLSSTAGLKLCLGRLGQGFIWPADNLYVISEDEIFGQKRGQKRAQPGPREQALSWAGFSQLHPGDPVVHEEHGIGLYGGLHKMEIQSKINDFILIQYAHGDKLYIPADRVSSLQKFVGADDAQPKLDQLGGRSWNITREKARKAIKLIARQLVQLYALRQYRQGYAFSQPDNYYREFEATFEHEETPDQIKAIEDVLNDMTSERPMDRLICGDVGFGKTEVVLRAAFKAVADGKQVALLVPTTVLAEQHFLSFKQRLEPYGIGIGILSRLKSQAEQRNTIAKLRSGKLQVLIGTHRMLQKDLQFMDLGLVIVDEEQRFGVKQKEALKQFRATVDVLAITATPIPRTLQMSLMGVRDLSVIETPPEDRLSIQTYLSPYDENLIARAVRAEMERGGQVFFVHNRVQTIEQAALHLRGLLPEVRIAIAHGQMPEKELEKTMVAFLKKQVDMLVCSTIIESGLDIPSANTIIINEAERLGLSQIYQLRGRVGRSKEKAYAYLLVGEEGQLTREAEKRLKALMDFSHLGAGLQLALHDLKIRGGGNILGFAQSGQISAVGYELYLRMIEQAVAELKGEDWRPEINPEINMDIQAYLPEDYIMDTDVRLNLYRRLSALNTLEALEPMGREIQDRFGPPPRAVEDLLWLMRLRIIAKQLGIARLDVGTESLTLTFSPEHVPDPGQLVSLAAGRPKRYRLAGENRLKILLGRGLQSDRQDRIMRNIEPLLGDRTAAPVLPSDPPYDYLEEESLGLPPQSFRHRGR